MKRYDKTARWLAAGVATILGMTVHAAGAPTVRVETGSIEGRSAGDIAIYRGVPFAAPPIGELRWRPPQSPVAWRGVRAATSAAPACMQTPQLDTQALHGRTFSEDCLYLNIWAPRADRAGALPVLVWIHGGGFIEGAPDLPAYDGENLARAGVIVVSVAHRLGAFGFLALPALSAESPQHVSGNYGLLDQIAALHWIQRNIGAFGGDPARVTIFGQSAGAISVSMLAASPLAKGLFHGVISQSGGSFGPARVPPFPGENMQTLQDAEHTGERFARQLPATTLAQLRQLPAAAVQGARFTLGDFWPAQDGWVIPDDQYRLYERGQYNDTPALVGSNSDEGALFNPQGTAAQYASGVHERFGPFADELLRLYPATQSQWRQSSMDLTRDAGFGWPSLAWARLQSRAGKAPVFVYYFAHVPPRAAHSRFKEATGAVHGEEIPYVFGNLSRQSLPWSAVDRGLSEQMVTYWTNFAKRGDPNGVGLAHWPAFGGSAPQVMHFDASGAGGSLPNAAKLAMLDRYYAWRRTAAGEAFARRSHD